jgi:RNA polymerase primary sigma factor
MAKTNAAAEPEEKSETGDAPLIDLNEASLKKLMARAKKRGYITYDEINEALPQDQMSSEQIEDVMSAFSEMGVNIVENEEADEDDPNQDADTGVDEVDGVGETFILEKKKETVDRTDDPVRMYLREMGAVELLSREGEIAIAKRIEAGRDTMIWGLCESPITFNAIIEWSNALNNGHMQLREILDLEAMLSKGPTAEQVEGEEADDDTISESTAGPTFKEEEEPEEVVAEEDEDEENLVERRAPRPVEEEDEDNTLSLAQMEETLKPAGAREVRLDHRPLQEVREAPGHADGGDERRRGVRRRRGAQVPEAARAAHRRGGERPVPRRQDRISRRVPPHRQPGPEGRARGAPSPRRRWSRPTCASSSRSPRNTPTAACSSWT